MKLGNAGLLLATAALAIGAPEPAYKPAAADRQNIQAKMNELRANLKALSTSRVDPDLLADVAVYHKAAEWILRYEEEFFSKAYVTNTLAALDTGIGRATELAAGKPSWVDRKGRFTRAYRSRVDGSLQPYGMIVPDAYDASKPGRIDIILHGRGATLNEVSFIAAHDAAKPIPPEQNYLQVEVFGRTNNAYRWSGETDVFEVLESVQKRYNVDPDRIVLRGFSMGGAGAWHIGLHHPSHWVAFEAGAGFTETKIYAKRGPLPSYQESLFHIYDARDYALNAFDIPTVGYGGEDDPQKQASINIREQLNKEGFTFTPDGLNWATKDLRALFLIGPKTQHKFHPDSKAISDKFIDEAVLTGRHDPDHIRFVTYTTRFNHCYWVTVDGLEHHYERADVDARLDGDLLTVRTSNVARLNLSCPRKPKTVDIDGQKMNYATALEKSNGKWQSSGSASGSITGLQKTHGLQGPIDDAFMDSFLCVRPTGPATPGTTYALHKLKQFSDEYARYLRGDIRVKDDKAVSADDIANNNLILFGDPGSNSLIARVVPKLPDQWTEWTKERFAIGKRQFSSSNHIPVLIYPNPLNPKKYVVINSGHTFHAEDFRGTNALLYPRLGDWAVEKFAGDSDEFVAGGLFNENWK